MITIAQLHKITGNTRHVENKQSFIDAMSANSGFHYPETLAQVLAQVIVESGGFRYTSELWGPTFAQRRYEGRRDLGNTEKGDGELFKGRGLIQVTGRYNYGKLSEWAGVDFVSDPELLATPEHASTGVVWYFKTNKRLMNYCMQGNNEMVTRLVNGGLNHFDRRLNAYDKAALVLLGYSPANVTGFQERSKLSIDGIVGPITRAALHKQLTKTKFAKAENGNKWIDLALGFFK